MATILIVEDDKNTSLLTSVRLRPHYTVLCCENGAEALDLLYRQPIDLVVSDVMMPVMDGFALLKALRDAGNQIPVLLLTAKDAFEDKRMGFSAGTDDYLTKPIHYDELLWHIKALLRRAKIADEKKMTVGELTVDANAYQVYLRGKPQVFPKKEFELLYKLLSYPGQIFTKSRLLEDIWGFDSDSTEDTVKTHISRLRARLKGVPGIRIVTLKGIGYRLDLTEEAAHEGNA